MADRYTQIDIAKEIGILLIIAGHNYKVVSEHGNLFKGLEWVFIQGGPIYKFTLASQVFIYCVAIIGLGRRLRDKIMVDFVLSAISFLLIFPYLWVGRKVCQVKSMGLGTHAPLEIADSSFAK